MTRVAIARTALPATGLNITDAAYQTMTGGANNGVTIPTIPGDVVILRNDTAGVATYTVKTAQPAGFSAQGITATDATVIVAAAKQWIYEPTALQKQADGMVYVDCDVAGKIVCLAMN
jgi:hypothetical protein